jgi:hypothetical protein
MVQLAPHGTPERYRQYPKGADRCAPCRDAWAAHTRAKRAADREARDAAGPLAQAAARGRGDGTAARLEALWAAEAEAEHAGGNGRVRTRGGADQLEPGDSGHDCPACGGARRWTGAHTVLVCLACKSGDSSPGAQAREADLEQARAERKTRAEGAAVARPGPTDTDVLALERRKGVMLEQLAEYAESARLRPGDARVIGQIERWVEQAESDARLDELIELLGGEVKRPRWWQASAAEQVIGALADDEDEYDEGEGEYDGAEAQAEADGGRDYWADYDRNTAAAARASAIHAAQVRQLRPRADAASARRQGFSACACGGWAIPAMRNVTAGGSWCRNCGALIRSPRWKRGELA